MHLAKFAASVCAVALTAAGAAVALAPPGSAATGTGVYSVAPYVDMSNGQEGLLDTAITAHGLKAYTAAFVLGSGCDQIWGDTLPVGADSYTDPEIARAESEGASVIISSGGAAGEPLAWTCSTQSSIDAGYQAIIDDYGVTQLDFDVEGAAVADTAAVARQMQAMKDLKASHPDLRFSMTLPVLATGLTGDGVNILQAAKDAGITIDVVNIMTMDYYSGTGTEMGQASVAAAQATLGQMQSVDPSYTYANLGITPMIGKNDDGSTFTLDDARTVESFAAQQGVGRLAFWSANRDQPCGGTANSLSTCSEISQDSLAFTDAFVPYQGSGTNTGGGTGSSDFSLALSPSGTSVAQGGSTTATVSTSVASGGAEPVSLSASGAPSGVSVSFSPADVSSGGSSTMTVAVGSSVAAGDYPLTVKGTATGGSHTATYTLTVTAAGGGGDGGGATGGGSLTDAGFESGLSPWTCASGSSVVSSPVHSGGHALQVVPSAASTGECDQAVTLSADHTYELTAYVQGPYAYLGVSGGATASTWSNGSDWNRLTLSFTTGSSGAVTVYVHGWYGQSAVTADDFTLS